MPSDGDKQKLSATGIDIKNVLARLSAQLHTKKILCILETCYCDASDLASTGTIVLTSSGPNELSCESKRYKNSVFTRSLINELGKATDNFASVVERTSQQIANEVQADDGCTQHPQLAGGDASIINSLFNNKVQQKNVSGDKYGVTGATVEVDPSTPGRARVNMPMGVPLDHDVIIAPGAP
jgi:hypothetical protein